MRTFGKFFFAALGIILGAACGKSVVDLIDVTVTKLTKKSEKEEETPAHDEVEKKDNEEHKEE